MMKSAGHQHLLAQRIFLTIIILKRLAYLLSKTDKGRLTKETDPLNNATAYTYDANGNLITKIDANSNTITYTYDSLNRLIAKNYPDTTKTLYTYDTMGNLITASNQHITYTYTYDNNGRITSVTDTFARVITYQYDTTGNRTRMTMPDGSITNYTYDANNRLTQITADVTQSFSFEYDALGKRTTLLYPNAMKTTYTYDAKANLIDITTQKAISTYKQTYQYDKTGNRTSYTEPNATHTYTYDPIYQLVSADHTNIPDETYTYDQTGNRLNTTVDAANRLTEDANYTYQYDNNGNLIRKIHKITQAAITYTYDFENRLIKINLPLGITAEYKYDPFGRRIEKNISGQITTKYLYDNEDIIMEYAAIIPTNTNITTKYIHGPGIDEPLSMIRNNKTYYYHADALGSITRMTDQNGNTVQTIKYDTFGNIKSLSNPLLIQPYAYTGREYDIESGFYYLRNRYYDPRTGRFISKDPIGFNGGDVNLYGYVGNNPVNWVDPWGLVTWPTNYPVVTGPYGPRGGGFHSGIDIRNPSGGTTYAVDSGIVIKAWHDSRGGNQILILNDDGTVSGYAHTTPNVKEGQRVTEGQPIGYSDDSGSGAPHLHYTYRPCPTCPKIDPMEHLKDAKEPCK